MIYLINSDQTIETYKNMNDLHKAMHDQSIRLSSGIPVKENYALCTFTDDPFEVMHAVNELRSKGML